MGSFLILLGLVFLAGGFCARSFSHELMNMISRADDDNRYSCSKHDGFSEELFMNS